MDWYTIEDEFLNYLRGVESRIPYNNYGDDKFKPFFGALFEVGDLIYVSQVSHAKPRHNNMKNSKDFVKLYKENRLIAVVNLNYMFPVHKSKLIKVEYKDIDKFRTFKDIKERSNYINLLNIEKQEIINNGVNNKAKKLYDFKYKYPNNKISLRCFDFKNLESKCYDYINKEIYNITQEIATDKTTE